MKENNSITAEDIKTRILKGISEVFRGKTIYMKDIEEDVEQYAQAKVLEALEKARMNIETSDQYYLNEVKRHDYTRGFNKAQILIVQQINELKQK